MKQAGKLLTTLTLALILLVGAVGAAGGGMGQFVKRAEYAPFPDVADTAWYAGDVREACELGLMTGKSATAFDPEGSLTLAEAVTLAARVNAIYQGVTFTPGGSPWYQNAVDYGEQASFLAMGEYDDFTKPATRSDMAGIFAFALPINEYQHINRVTDIPDVTYQNSYIDYIYLLYNAGILTGDSTGAFLPDAAVTRAEAAALVNRLALPERRLTVQASVSSAGKRVDSLDGGASLLIPQDWQSTTAADKQSVTCSTPDGAVSLTLRSIPLDTDQTLRDAAAACIQLDREDAGGSILVTQQPQADLFRGLPAYRYQYQSFPESGQEVSSVYCVARGAYCYALTIRMSPATATEDSYSALWTAAYSFDLAL